MFDIKLFGTGFVKFNGQLLTGFPNQQPGLLLCYLLLNRDYPQNRELLATTLWPEVPSATARKCLRNALWRLRQNFESVDACLDEALLATEDSLSLINFDQINLDIQCFEAAIVPNKDLAGWQLSVEQVTQLELAIDLRCGDLLEGVYEDWVLYDRERLNLLFLNTLNKLMVYYGMNGFYERGLACGEKILVLDRTYEKIYRQMMWLFCLLGDNDLALKKYRQCCQVMRDELGIDPMPETRRLYEKILHDQFNPHEMHFLNEALPDTPHVKNQSSMPPSESTYRKLRFIQDSIENMNSQLSSLNQLLAETMNQLQSS